MTKIHPSALIAKSAQLGEDVEIGPFVIIEEGAQIGDRCEIAAQAQIRAKSIVGADCYIGSGTLIGADPHYVKFNRAICSWARLGSKNLIREYVTIHRSIEEGGATTLGDDNYLMTGAHLGHDCAVGNHNILANNVLLGGHVQVGNFCFLGGASAFHQFIRIGDYVMAKGLAGISQDIPPYTMVAGTDNEVAGLNVVGIKRAGFEMEDRNQIKEVFKVVYRSQLNLNQALAALDKVEWGPTALVLINFLKSESRKGICLKVYK